MKTFSKIIFYILILAACFTTSCSNLSVDFAKRKYRSGYYVNVSLNKNQKKVSENNLATSPKENFISEKIKTQKHTGKTKDECSSADKKNVVSVSHQKVQPSKKLREIIFTTPSAANKESAAKTKSQLAKKSKESNAPDDMSNLFYLLAALTALGSGGLVMSQHNRAIKISKWSRNNPAAARAIQIIGHSVLGLGSFIGGSMLYNSGVAVSSNTFDIFTAAFLASCSLYPLKKHSRTIFKTKYYRYKLNDIAIIISSLMMCATGGNIVAHENATASTQHIISYKPIQKFFNDVSVKTNSLFLLGDDKSNPEKKKTPLWVKILLTILTIAAAIILTVLLAALACTLSCQGNEGMAILVLVFGLAFLIGLTILAARGIKNMDEPIDNDN